MTDCESTPVEALPEVAPPVENPPVAVQDVTFLALQESVDDCPASIVPGNAENEVMVGEFAGSGNTEQL